MDEQKKKKRKERREKREERREKREERSEKKKIDLKSLVSFKYNWTKYKVEWEDITKNMKNMRLYVCMYICMYVCIHLSHSLNLYLI